MQVGAEFDQNKAIIGLKHQQNQLKVYQKMIKNSVLVWRFLENSIIVINIIYRKLQEFRKYRKIQI